MRAPVQLKPDLVIISEREMWRCEQKARERRDPKRAAGVAESFWRDEGIRRNDSNGHERDLMGVLGEYAVSAYFHEPMDLHISLAGDGNVCDLIIGGLTASVKCVRNQPSPHLKFGSPEEFHQDVAVLTMLEEPNAVRLLGWTTPEHFAECYRYRTYGKRGEAASVEVADLYHILALKAIAFDQWRSLQVGGGLCTREQCARGECV